jgi:hypothetical protein
MLTIPVFFKYNGKVDAFWLKTSILTKFKGQQSEGNKNNL